MLQLTLSLATICESVRGAAMNQLKQHFIALQLSGEEENQAQKCLSIVRQGNGPTNIDFAKTGCIGFHFVSALFFGSQCSLCFMHVALAVRAATQTRLWDKSLRQVKLPALSTTACPFVTYDYFHTWIHEWIYSSQLMHALAVSLKQLPLFQTFQTPVATKVGEKDQQTLLEVWVLKKGCLI